MQFQENGIKKKVATSMRIREHKQISTGGIKQNKHSCYSPFCSKLLNFDAYERLNLLILISLIQPAIFQDN